MKRGNLLNMRCQIYYAELVSESLSGMKDFPQHHVEEKKRKQLCVESPEIQSSRAEQMRVPGNQRVAVFFSVLLHVIKGGEERRGEERRREERRGALEEVLHVATAGHWQITANHWSA